MLDMAKKKPSGGHEPNRSPAWILHARLAPRFGAAFEAYLNSLRPKPSAKAVLELILDDWLKEKGFPPDDYADAGEEGGAS